MSDILDTGAANGISVDADYDGFAESTYIDSDADGFADAVIYQDPFTGSVDVLGDTDGDGWFDTEIIDFDNDGSVDLTLVDLNGDGFVDEVIAGDQPLMNDTGTDMDLDDNDPVTVLDTFDNPSIDEVAPFADTPEVNDDSVHGEPMADIQYHQAQPGDVDCVPTSIAMVLSEVTDETVPASTVVSTANDLGVMNEMGMYPEDAIVLFEQFGIEAQLETGTLDDLATALDSGEEIVVGLDAADLYYEGGGPFDPGLESAHAVVITGIDDEAGLVYINDPWFSDGGGVAIPVEDFLDGWEDSDNVMIVTEGEAAAETSTAATVTEGEAETSTAATVTEGKEALSSKIILPVSFTVRAS